MSGCEGGCRVGVKYVRTKLESEFFPGQDE